jgi:hypothetical protein
LKPGIFPTIKCFQLFNSYYRMRLAVKQLKNIFFGDFFTASSAAPQIPPTVPTDAGIEPRTVASGALAVRRSNH